VQGQQLGNQSDPKLSPQALAAIAEAARRSRVAGVGPEPRRTRAEVPRTYGNVDASVTAPAPPATQVAPAANPGFTDAPTGARRRRARPSGSSERRLRLAIGIAASLLVVVLAALLGTANSGDQQPDGQATATTGYPGPASGAVGKTSGHGGVSPAATSTTLTKPSGSDGQATATTEFPGPRTTTLPSGSSGSGSGHAGVSSTPTSTALTKAGPPALTALAPTSGQAGQMVTVTGSNFLSPSGQISAEIGGQMAPVACPDQTTCTVVIPPDQESTSSASVAIITDSGTSNTLTFTYGHLSGSARHRR